LTPLGGDGKVQIYNLTEVLLSSKVPTATKVFLGRKEELIAALSLLQEHAFLFVTGIAGIGKSEFAKTFANKYNKKYTNILFLHYTGSLKKCIIGLSFADDTAETTEDELFQNTIIPYKNCVQIV
jgi:AAA+ ATPase superfamily predicted ATPase